MSYLHCPTCQRAFNLAVQATCPHCPVHATIVDPAEDIVAAAEQLARAMQRATPSERNLAAWRMERLALPSADDESARHRAPVMRQIRDVLSPPTAPLPKPLPLWMTLANSVERRFSARAHLLLTGLRRVRARVKALA